LANRRSVRRLDVGRGRQTSGMRPADPCFVWNLSSRRGGTADPDGVHKIDSAAISDAADRLASLLAQHGININPSSWLAKLIANARRLPSQSVGVIHLPNELPDETAARLERMRLGMDMMIIADVVEAASGAIHRELVKGRLRALRSGCHASTTKASSSLERNLAFELVCAGWLSQFAADVAFAEPPDLLCDFEGVRWGVACKVAYGSPNESACDITRGAMQLESSPCHVGVVVMRISDVFPHHQVPGFDAERRMILSAPTPQHAFDLADRLADEVVGPIVAALGSQGAERLMKKHPKLQAVVFVGHTLAHVHGSQGAVPTGVPIFKRFLTDEPGPRFVDELFLVM